MHDTKFPQMGPHSNQRFAGVLRHFLPIFVFFFFFFFVIVYMVRGPTVEILAAVPVIS